MSCSGYAAIQSREEFKTSKAVLSLCFAGQREGMMQYRNIRALLFLVLNFPECRGNFKEALNYLGSLTSELWSLILRDAFSVENQTLLNKDRLVLSFQIDSPGEMARGLHFSHFSLPKKLKIQWSPVNSPCCSLRLQGRNSCSMWQNQSVIEGSWWFLNHGHTAMQLLVVHLKTGLLFFGKRVALGRRQIPTSLSISV